MKATPQLIVMLTHNDCTVENAHEIFRQCKDSDAKFWGFKEKPLPLPQMKALYSYMKECGKTTLLEVVEYTEKECLEGAKMAAECGCDILMGTCFFDSVNSFCQENHLKYMPFVGKITGRPSVCLLYTSYFPSFAINCALFPALLTSCPPLPGYSSML